MTIVNGGSGSTLSGKAKGMVYVELNGQTIMRSAPRYSKNSATPRMLLNQQRFKEVNQFCAQFKTSVIPQIWNGMDKRMSGYALFLKSNMAAFGPDGSLEDATKLRFSMGKLVFPQGFEAHRLDADNQRIEVSWPRELHTGGIHLKDELMVISSENGLYSDITATGINRGNLKGTFELPPSPLPHASGPQHIYLFFGSKDHRSYSESVCMEV